MSHTDRLKRCPAVFRRLTGLTPAKFDALLTGLAPRAAAGAARRQRPDRRRQPGAGRKHKLPLADRLLMLLIYYRTDTTHAFLGFLFGVDDSAVGRNINPLQPLLAGLFRIPQRRVALTPEEIRALFFDSTECPTQRPVRRQRRWYSGKKKRHTIKHQVVVVRLRKRPGRRGQPRRVRIVAVSPAFPGRTHDKRIFDRASVRVPAGVKRFGDTAYLGTGLRTPVRKPKGGSLTHRQQRGNRRLARRRVVAEHGIGKMKVWKVVAERYRGRRRKHTLIVKNVAGLHNLMFA